MKQLVLVLLLLPLQGCSFWPFDRSPPPATLADLEPVEVPEQGEALPPVSLVKLESAYRQALPLAQSDATRLELLHRLADLEMLQGESAAALADGPGSTYVEAIAAYESLLQENPDYPLEDRLLYQLSRAYELNGNPEQSVVVLERLSAAYPESDFTVEAEFRRAESYFTAGQYREAEGAYERVLAAGEDTAHYRNALYMSGWSLFKQGAYEESIAPFTGTLDLVVPEDNRLADLARADRELALDCLRVMALVFSYLEGADTIAAVYDQLGVRPYQYLLYRELGDLYLQQERFRDSAETYRAYSERYPRSREAHRFQTRVIETYLAAGFSAQIISEKQRYVSLFSVDGEYWQHSTDEEREEIRPPLKQYLAELASHHHALARKAADSREALADEEYARASDYYQLYIDSFPADSEVPSMAYLLGESHFEAGNYPAAIEAWEWLAYEMTDVALAPDAAYAAVLAHEPLLLAASPDEQAELRAQRTEGELRFAITFPGDARAPKLQGQAAATLFEMADYDAAVTEADTLVNWQPQPGPDLLQPAWLVIGHSQFELAQYSRAEQAYQEALALMPTDHSLRPATEERVAASIYRQAEEAVAVQDHGAAAQEFARVASAAPDSEIRVTAHYDAARQYALAGELLEAERLLVEFRVLYPSHELTPGIAAQLVTIYEQLDDWGSAASELDQICSAADTVAEQGQALYLAAEYYALAGESENAITRFRKYAHTWPEPVAVRLEAMNHLQELYRQSGQVDKRSYWLDKTMLAHDQAGSEQTLRSRYLAARAASVRADQSYQAFLDVQLVPPLQRSLKKKSAAMEQTLAAYQRTNDYGEEQFSTLATYRMGTVYRRLGRDLLASPRPEKLDALALQQYELLLEEQAYPFEEKAIAIHETNARRSQEGIRDQWVRASLEELAELWPARYGNAQLALEAAAVGAAEETAAGRAKR